VTIEQEAREIWKNFGCHGDLTVIAKALQAKQDRIDELEQESKGRMDQIIYAKAELRRCYDKINELENELRAYDLDIYGADGAKEISNMRKRIETLESALRECNGWLKEVEESGIRYVCIGAKSQREKLEKALGGGACE
jgi:chromosome segregation ATPase